MYVCQPPLPPDAGEVITSTVSASPHPNLMTARKCRDGSWVVTVAVSKDGQLVEVNSLVVPAPHDPKK